MTISQSTAATDLQAMLALAERCAAVVSQALLEGRPEVIESAARDFHDVSLSLARRLESRKGKTAPDPNFSNRLSKVLQTLAMQREALLRRSAVVERSLHSMVPATRASTYAGGTAPYGHNARQSGAFKLLSA